jgi:uncharacterized protein (TIGR00255 family)
MTGYGTGESDGAGLRTSVEMRAVNGRFCEISVRMPRFLAPLEGRVREHVQAQVKRGTVSVAIRCDGETEETASVTVDVETGRRYCEALRRLQEALGLPGEVTVGMIAAYPGLLKDEPAGVDPEQAWAGIAPALTDALAAMTAMKEREGALLARDLAGRVALLKKEIDGIEARAPVRVEQMRQRLHMRIAELLGDEPVDPQRLAMEVTLFADRSDVTEECVRFRTHCDALLAALDADDGAGRRLNFLLQEMNREVNTIGAKANDAEISHRAIVLKEELEKIREQVQNIE